MEPGSRVSPTSGSQIAASRVPSATAEYVHVSGPVPRTRVRPDAMFDTDDPQIKDDLVRMITQWCEDEGYYASMLTIQDEANVKHAELEQRDALMLRLRKSILDGDWAEAERCARAAFKQSKPLLFAVYRQQYLELIAAQEVQKAFALLGKRLKPLEAYARSQADFKDLCYLLTCKNVQDGLASWEGVATAREWLAEHFQTVLDLDEQRTVEHGGAGRGALAGGSASLIGLGSGGSAGGGAAGGGIGASGAHALSSAVSARRVPERRLWSLLRQAYAYQVEFSPFRPRMNATGEAAPAVRSLLEDYTCPMLPNALHATLRGHLSDVKAVAFLGAEGTHAVSGGSDNSLLLWDCRDGGRRYATLSGHTGRVWSVSSPPSGRIIVSAGGEGAVRLWTSTAHAERAAGSAELSPRTHSRLAAQHAGAGPDFRCLLEFGERQQGALYTASASESEQSVVSAGFDRKVRVYDVNAGGKLVSSLIGHESAVTSATFNQAGNLVISGSKDSKVRFWDVRSGLCIKALSSTLIGEVSSIALASSGLALVVCSRNNANRLWDIRMSKALATYKGHHNTSANFVRARFGPKDETIVGGSEDGCVYLWDAQTGAVLHRLRGHEGVVYDVDWSERASQLVSCSHDGTVRLWMWEGGTDCLD